MKKAEDPSGAVEMEEGSCDEIWDSISEVLESLGYEHGTDDGFFLSSIEAHKLIFPIAIYLTDAGFLGVRIRMAGEIEVPLERRYLLSTSYIQDYLYGTASVDTDEGLYLWRYEGIPVSLDSIESVLVSLLDEIGVSLCEFIPVFQAMEEGEEDRKVLEIAKTCATFFPYRKGLQARQ